MPRPFVPPGTQSHYVPDRPVAVTHVRLEWEPDLPGRTLAGQVTLSMTARRDGLDVVELHAVDMTIGAITLNGRPVPASDYDGERLRVRMDRRYARDERFHLAVAYRCTPRRGLYFVGPDESHPERALECWTQGQDEDSRHYWPCVDLPIEKATSEVLCTVPAGLRVLSNGDLRETRKLSDGRVLWHYVLDVPHSPYLVTLACGPFSEQIDRAPATGVAVYYYGPQGRDADVRRSLGRTPEMIDFFSERIGVPYPFRRYSQIYVSDFIFGGMENTTATTLTSEALLDERAALDHDVEALVAHELAHQWWGDLITCREWPEAWLNEGFATYFEYVWREHSRGRDEADADLLGDLDAYLGEAGHYQRPIFCRQYEEPIDLFDRHLYEKGGRVLHMLRQELGDDVFWRALRLYAERHARGTVETRDLARAVEDASGRNMDGFFDQWVNRAGHPELELGWEWDADKGLGTLRLEQKQTGEPFRFHAQVRFEVEGQTRDEVVKVRERTHGFEFRLPARPTQVVFDPGDVLLKTAQFKKGHLLWARQLRAAALGIDRLLAARALVESPSPAAVGALRAALETDTFWAVRAAAATALGKTRRQDALDALLLARDQPNPRVRRAVAAALGEFRVDYAPGNQRAAEILEHWVLQGDASCFVEANAALALGRTRSALALDVLPRALNRPAYQDVIRARAIEGLGASGDEAALPLVEALFSPAASLQARRAMVAAFAHLAEGTTQARRARERVEAWLTDRDFRVRMEAASALVLLGDMRAVRALEQAQAAELDGRARRRMREAVVELREKGRPAERMRKLEEEVERLNGEAVRLRERLEKLEERATKGEPPPPSPAPEPAKPASRRPRPGSRRGTKPLAPRRRR